MKKLYKVNLLQQFSSLQLPWTITQNGATVPLRLEDAPHDSQDVIGFLPVFGSREAAEAFSNGRWTIDEITLNNQETPINPTGRARLTPPVQAPAPAPPPTEDNTITINPERRGRRRGRK